jgi:hypothetical protein
LADQLQAGTVESGFESLGLLLGLSAVLGAVKEVIEAEPPTKELEAAWEEARQAVEITVAVASKWFDSEITSQEALDLLMPAAEHADKALELAGRTMTNEYGVTESQMIAARQTAEAGIRAIFEETPTPAESE